MDKVALAAKQKQAMKDTPPGQGSRFHALAAELAQEKGVTNPGALAAAIGRKKYGNAGFEAMAAKGK